MDQTHLNSSLQVHRTLWPLLKTHSLNILMYEIIETISDTEPVQRDFNFIKNLEKQIKTSFVIYTKWRACNQYCSRYLTIIFLQSS